MCYLAKANSTQTPYTNPNSRPIAVSYQKQRLAQSGSSSNWQLATGNWQLVTGNSNMAI